MADLATPSAAAMSTGNSGTEDLSATAHKVKPDRPDEEKYKEDLGKAEKENSLAQEKYVSSLTGCYAQLLFIA
jgi:hypothetical protein